MINDDELLKEDIIIDDDDVINWDEDPDLFYAEGDDELDIYDELDGASHIDWDDEENF